MPRAEQPLEPDGSALTEFAAELRKLRERAGRPTYRELAARAHFSSTTLSDAAGGKRLPSLAVTLAYVRGCGGDVAEWEQRWHAVRAASEIRPVTPDVDGTAAPYVGLAGYEVGDADRYVGREQLVADLAERVERQRFTAVFGPSGSGKSSALRAGLIPALSGRTALITPGARPMAALDGVDADVVVVDQFEELFTLCGDEAERERFIAALLDAPHRVVIGVRADFYPHCAQHPGLVAAMQDAQVTVGPMTTDELRRAIVTPAARANCSVEGALLATLMSEASGRPGILPLLSHALLETWVRRAGAKLTLAGYQSAGGIAHALARTADTVFDGFSEARQRTARDLFVRLCVLGEGTEDTRRRVPRSELDPGVDDVITQLVDARLVVADRESVEITHEALIRSWPRLRRWLSEDREGLRIHRAVTEATAAWEAMDRDPSALYRGARLEQALQWRGTASLSSREREFLDASELGRHAELAVARRRTQRLRVLLAAVVVFAVVAGAAAVVAGNERTTALKQRDDAQFQQVLAESDWLRDRDPALSAQLAMVAWRLRPGDDSVRTRLLSTQTANLAQTIGDHNGNVYWTSFSPDGAVLATADADDTFRLWDPAARPALLASMPGDQNGWVSAAVFSPVGRVLATTGQAGTVQLWNVADPKSPKRFGPAIAAVGGSVSLLAFSPDGRLLATADNDGTVGLWSVVDPAHPRSLGVLRGHTEAVRSVAFSSDGRLLASGGNDTTVRVWNIQDAEHPVAVGNPLTGNKLLVHAVTFSPDNRFVVSGGQDGTVRIWDVGTGAAVGAPLSEHTSGVWSVAFSHDGSMLATGSADGTAGLWNVADLAHPALLSRATAGGDVYTVSFAPDDNRVVTGSSDGVVRLWSLPGRVLLGHRTTVDAVAFRVDGKLVATGSLDGVVRLWRVEDSSLLAEIPAPAGEVASCSASCTDIEISPDGRLLAVLSQAKVLRLWDIHNPEQPVLLNDGLRVKTPYRAAFAFSPDGRTMALPEDDHSVQLWDVTDPRAPFVVGRVTGEIGGNAVVFSPNGRLLATVDSDHSIRLWDVSVRSAPRAAEQLTGNSGAVVTIAFSPDGGTLASAGSDQTVRLWDVAARAAAVMPGHTRSVSTVAFSPDGRTLASGSTDQTIRFWDVGGRSALGAPMAALTSRGAGLTYSPDGRYLAVSDDANAVRLLDLDVEHAVSRICGTTDPVKEAQWWRYLPTLAYDQPCAD
ncbi:MAG TPA: helix-turn-helix domain-containing protein [Kutzneria sp.]